MAQTGNQELTERFIQFYRNYYREEVGRLAQEYPNERRSLYVDYNDLFTFDRDLAEDYLTKPDQMQEYAEEALRLYDLPADVSLGQAHVRLRGLPSEQTVDIRDLRVQDDHIGSMIAVQGIVRKATDVRPKVTEAAFECQRCGTMSYIPQSEGSFQEPHECQGCERQGPFSVNHDQSEFVDSQKLRVQESPEGLRGGETPQSIDVDVEDDITGDVTAGDHVTVTGVLHIEQVTQGQEKTALFDLYMDGVTIEIEDEEFEDMDISDEDIAEIVELSNEPNIYEKMVGSIAPAIYGYEQEKLAMVLQLFSGVTKHLPDGSRIRGDLHLLLIGDPGTGKCLKGDTRVTLHDGRKRPIRDIVEENLDDPKPVDDGVWDEVDFEVPSMQADGRIDSQHATKVWKREAPEKLYRIRTASGRKLEVTPSHPLFVPGGAGPNAIRASELEAGQFVATPRSLPTDGDDALDVKYRRSKSYNAVRLDLPEQWTPSLARLIGYIVAEGYVEQRPNDTGFVSITNNDREVLADVGDALDRVGLNYSEREPHEGKDAREIICSSGEFVSFLDSLAPTLLESSDSQRVPEAISTASDRTKRAFLRAFVEGEGHVAANEREISIASMSEALLEDVRSLLVSLGVGSQLQPRRNGSYRLRISGDGFAEYVAKIGFVTERKSAAANDHTGTTGNTNTDVIPVGDELRSLREALGLTQSECGLPRTTYQHYERGDRNPSRESLRNVVDAFDTALPETRVEEAVAVDGGSTLRERVEGLRALVDGDLGWDRIESIEPVEPEDDWVYDLEVEGTHNYFSNGVVSHNSQMISYVEQVAPRSVYTSGKGSSAAGLTAAAVRDDFGDGQQWTLEAGALVLADKGIAAVDELDKMDCVTGDTLVTLSDGRVERIDELAREAAKEGEIEELSNGQRVRDVDLDVWTMDDDGKLVERPVSTVHEYEAPSELTRVKMATGEELTATADHPFFVLDDGERAEREAASLDAGDWVYVPREVPTKAADGAGAVAADLDSDSVPGDEADGVSPAMASVLGYLSGDGNVYYNREEGSYGVRFVNSDEDLLDDFERAARDAFDATPTRPPSEQRGGVETVRVHGKDHADAVLSAGMNLGRYDEKCFPTAVSTGSRAAKAAFVRALADSEGNVDTATGNVRITSASRDLLCGTKNLLLQFGVSSQLQHRERDGKRDVYLLTITDADSLVAFQRFVGFTATRKAEALERVVESADGDRTILDVVPVIDDTLAELRESLRLHQSECGIESVTYCNFENGDANVSLHRAQRILDAFERRRETAAEDRSAFESTTPEWKTLSALKERYHVSQSELADGTELSQQQISRGWGSDDSVRQTVTDRLREIVAGIAETDLGDLREFVQGDVKWRRVESIETVDPESTEHRDRVLRERLADVLGGDAETAEERARDVLDREPAEASTWDELEAHGVSQSAVATRIGVDQATVSRWLSGTVETDRFDDARDAALTEIDAVRGELRSLLDRIEDGQTPKVYDLTVEGTHNFVANGLITHNSSDRSAMHEGLEQQKISVSKAGINATLKSRCSLLGAANPKYGRFDQYEPIGEQIDLEPALISRFDLIFTVTDQPDPEHDSRLAEHILKTNYAGELHTQREQVPNSEYTAEEVENVTEEVAPDIDAELLRKYIAYAKRNVYPTMSDEAKDAIEEFYVDLRSKGADEDAPVPVTARKLEALVRLAEASARVRLSDVVEEQDAEKVIEVVRNSLEDIGVDPETGEFDADVVETGTSKSQRDRIKSVKALISDIEEEYDEGAPIEEVLDRAGEVGMDEDKAEKEIESLRKKGELYEPVQGHLRTT